MDPISLDFRFLKVLTLICLCFAWIPGSLDPISLDFCFLNVITLICVCFAWILGFLDPISIDFCFSKVITLVFPCFAWILINYLLVIPKLATLARNLDELKHELDIYVMEEW